MRVGEARHDAAPAEVDALVGDERAVALAHVDAAPDAVARDRERARQREARIARAHAAVVEDHAAEGSPSPRSVAIVCVRAAAPASGRGDRSPHRGVPARPGAGRPRRGARRAVGRPRLSQRDGAERASRSCLRAASRCCSCAATSSARAPRARCAASSRSRRCARCPRRSPRSACPSGCASGSSSTCCRRRPTCATRRCCRAPSCVDCMPALWAARSRKSEWEVTRIRAACAQSQAAMEYAPQVLVPGRPECDVLSELGHHMRMHGHEGTIRFRGINSEFFFGQVLAGESGGRARADRDAAARARALGGPGPRPVAAAAARGRRGRRRHLRAVRGLRLGPDAHVLRAATPIRCCSRPTTPAAASLPSASRCCARGRRGARSSSARSRWRPRPGHAERFMGAGDGRVKFVGHCIGLELNEPPYLARGYGAARDRQRRRDRAQARVHRARRRGRREQLSDRRRTARCSSPERPRSRSSRDRRRPLPSPLRGAGGHRARARRLEPDGLGAGGGRRARVVPRERRGPRARGRAGPGRQSLGDRAGRGGGPVRRGRLAPRLGRRRRRLRRCPRRGGRARRGRGRAPRRRRAHGRSRWARWSTRKARASARRSSARARCAASSTWTPCSRARIPRATSCATWPRCAA